MTDRTPRRPACQARRGTGLLGIAVALAGIHAAGCGRASGPANLLLVTLDTVRADHCSAYGYARPTTPRMARLASEGVRFDAAYAPMPSTGPSHASLFTSLPPFSHGVLRNGYVLAPQHATLAEILRAHGYRTAAIVSSYPLKEKFGYGRGFELYDDSFAPGEASIPHARWEGEALSELYDRRAQATSDRATDWIAQHGKGGPFFLWVHYFDPHSPYDPPEPYRSRFLSGVDSKDELARDVAAYDAEIAFTDAQMGRVLDGLEAAGLGGTTLVVIAGDHGEGLRQHGEKEHGPEIYEEAVRVPLVVRWPRVRPRRREWSTPVELLDVAHTVLDLLRIGPPPAAFRGVSLARAFAAERPESDREIFLQAEFDDGPRGNTYGLRRGPWKYIERRREGQQLAAEFYRLSEDPQERQNLLETRPVEAERFRAAVELWRKRRDKASGAPQGLSEEDRAALRALGYVR